MKKMEINDLFAKGGRIRADGRAGLRHVCSGSEEARGLQESLDYLEIKDTISGADAYQPLSDSRCPLVKN
jgi:branched-chain amino acid transport system substrate-binding protein